ncbi:glycosyltransferase family 39 protein [Herminiimonas sp. CN]|uniref:ArnT family glycosyltransferase n=1 Tax=Herminiimonas sp. CN TaxID=1349818 RepID=UPI0004740F3E|nr:glycosyltransferase family 39 protein [Herminiimonas sp. CN]
MNDLHQSKPVVWALFLIFTLCWFYALDLRTLVPTDEGRYAEMAREMVASGDWITTRLNGIKYFEKPPLQTWMNALTFTLFGLGEWQARFWTGLCGFFGILLTYQAGRSVFGARVGFLAALVLGSSFLWAALGHINTLDMGLSGMMTLALCSLLIAQRDDADARARRNWMLACWAGMALAVLSKGLIGLVLPGAVLVIYSLAANDFGIWKRLHIGKGLLLFFAITTPWFVLVSIRNPEFPYFFFIHEHFQRFTSEVHHRAGPWYYFIPLLLLGIAPWLGILFQSVLKSWSAAPGSTFKPKRMLLVWAGFIFFFFSISGSKLPSYILPIFPALALLIAVCWDAAGRLHLMLAAGLMAASGAVGLFFVPRIGTMTDVPLEIPLYLAYEPWVTAAAIAMLIGGIGAFLAAQRGRRELAATVLAISGFVGGQLLMIGHDPLGNYASGRPLVAAIEAEITPTTTLYSVGRLDHSLLFYLRRTMVMVENPDELDFELKRQPQLWLPTREAFIKQWASGPKAVAVTTPTIYADLQQRGVPMRIIARDGRRIAIANDAKP